jgi:hypothetical protein
MLNRKRNCSNFAFLKDMKAKLRMVRHKIGTRLIREWVEKKWYDASVSESRVNCNNDMNEEVTRII